MLNTAFSFNSDLSSTLLIAKISLLVELPLVIAHGQVVSTGALEFRDDYRKCLVAELFEMGQNTGFEKDLNGTK